MRKRRTSTKLSLKLDATGMSTGRRPHRNPRTPGLWVNSSTSPGTEQQQNIPKGEQKGVEEASVSTQLVLNKYNTNYEALKLADSTSLAFNLAKILLKLYTTSG